MKQTYRKLVTKRGVYFVVWRPDDVAQLIADERLVPSDFFLGRRQEVHLLIRDLYLLACKGDLAGWSRNTNLSLASYAREMHSTMNSKH